MTKNSIIKNSVVLSLCILFAAVFVFALAFPAFADSAEQVLIDKNTVWKYIDDNTDPAQDLSGLTAWTLADFDDSSWKSAKGSFGSKNGEIASISHVTPTNLISIYKEGTSDCVPAVFFRSTFNVENLSQYHTLSFKISVDDAAAVYINGKLVLDTRAKSNTATNLYYTSNNTSVKVFAFELSKLQDVLLEGENVIAVQVHNNSRTSSDILFSLEKMVLLGYDNPIIDEQVILNVGSSEKERNLSWLSNIKDEGEVRLAEASAVLNGVFPAECVTFEVTSKLAANAVGRYAKAATLTGLSENTEYAYVIEADGKTSKIYYFKTGSFSDYSFVFFGDPQIFNAEHSKSWKDTVNKVIEKLNPEFLISGGDQVNAPEEESYYAYFAIDALSGISIATTVGPGHDSGSATFSDHFNLPNLSKKYGVSTASADYWYTYGNTLFMHLDMSDTDAAANGEHEKFLMEAIAANPDAVWKIVVMHVSLFSTAQHGDPDYKYFEKEVKIYRPALTPVFTKLGIDAVLSAHDHVYVRTHMMTDSEISTDIVENNRVVDPVGTLYLCANSSTGSKFYAKRFEGYFTAFENYEKRKSAVQIEVTDNTLTLTSYFIDTMKPFDYFTIEKGDAHRCQPEKVEGSLATCVDEGRKTYYACECGRNYEDEAGFTEIENIAEWEVISATGHLYVGECETECYYCTLTRETVTPHADEDGDTLCDICSTSLAAENGNENKGENKSGISPTVIVIIAAATVAAASVAIIVIKKKKG